MVSPRAVIASCERMWRWKWQLVLRGLQARPRDTRAMDDWVHERVPLDFAEDPIIGDAVPKPTRSPPVPNLARRTGLVWRGHEVLRHRVKAEKVAAQVTDEAH